MSIDPEGTSPVCRRPVRCRTGRGTALPGCGPGRAKVRQVLRDGGPFTEVWRGRWQAGQVGEALLRYLNMPATPPGLA
jgi:hypothetical protein